MVPQNNRNLVLGVISSQDQTNSAFKEQEDVFNGGGS